MDVNEELKYEELKFCENAKKTGSGSRGGSGGCERRCEVIVNIKKKKRWWGSGVGRVRFGGGGGGQGGCERRIEVIVKMQKKKYRGGGCQGGCDRRREVIVKIKKNIAKSGQNSHNPGGSHQRPYHFNWKERKINK